MGCSPNGVTMPIQPPPRFVVRPADAPPPSRMRRGTVIVAWLLNLVLVALLTAWLAGGDTGLPVVGHGQRQLRTQNETLKQQLADLRQARTVDQVSMKHLQSALSDRDEEVNGLRADLAFYSRLVGGAQRDGLHLHLQRVTLAPVAGAQRAWNLGLTLTRNARKGGQVDGKVTLTVEGIDHGKLTTLDEKALAGNGQSPDLSFSFKYFQQLHGTLMLPAGFTPNRLKVSVQPRHGSAVEQTVNWADALNKAENNDVESDQG